MSRGFVISHALLGASLALLSACRPGEGQRCVCEGECRRGLVCAQGGRVLDDNECLDPSERSPGECVEQDGLPDMADEGVTPFDVVYHDLGGKRDFEPGTPVDDEGEASTASSGDGSSTSTSTSTSTISSSGTSGSSGTGGV